MNITTWCIQISFLDKTTSPLWFQRILSLCHWFLNILTSSEGWGQRSWSQPFRWPSSPPKQSHFSFCYHQKSNCWCLNKKQANPAGCTLTKTSWCLWFHWVLRRKLQPCKLPLLIWNTTYLRSVCRYAWPKKLDIVFFTKYQTYHTIHGTGIFTYMNGCF